MIMMYFLAKNTFAFLWIIKKNIYFCLAFKDGAIAQLVEQRTENPCVPSSILGGATKSSKKFELFFLFVLAL